jgi:pimeloyl-ACP methyl ester carboxylesterase
MADDLDRLMQHLGIDKFILMGHSMGGKTAMWYAHKFPNKLEKMIVVDIGIKQYPMHHNEIIKGIRSVPLENVASRSEAEKSLLPFVDSYGVRQFLLKNLYWKEKGQLAWRMNVDVLEREMTEILSTLEMEENWTVSLFIRGELSNYILDEDWEEIEAVFPDSSLVTIQDAGHWVHAEQPEIFIDTVLGFCLR